jgi:hypothetical protein
MATPPPSAATATPSVEALGPWIARALEIGGGVLPALRALVAGMPAGKRRAAWIEVCDTIDAGDTARVATGIFRDPELWMPLLTAAPPGATTGDGRSEVAFVDAAIDATGRDDSAAAWWRPAVYPLVVMAIAIAVGSLLAALVVPTFKQIFSDFGIRLPAITIAVIALSDFVHNYWWMAVVVAAAASLAWLSRRRWWPSWLVLPGTRLGWSARFARFAADLLEARVPEADAITVASAASSGWPGGAVADPGSAPGQRWMTAGVRHAIGIALEPDKRATLLRQLAICHDQRLGVGRSWMAWCLGPLAIFVTGFFVFLLVLGLFMPLIKLVTDLS